MNLVIDIGNTQYKLCVFNNEQLIYHAYVDTFDTERNVIILGPAFSDNGLAMVVVRSQDNKDRWIMLLNMEDGSLSLLDRQRDEAWIGGPGIVGWNFSTGTV